MLRSLTLLWLPQSKIVIQKKTHIVLMIVCIALIGAACSTSRSVKNAGDREVVDPSTYKNENSYFYFLLSQLKLPQNTQADAESFLDKAIEKNSSSSFLWHVKAYSEAESGRIAESKASALKSLHNNPKNPETLFLLGKIASFEKDALSAESYLQKSIAIDDHNEETYQFLAREFVNANDPQSAIKVLKTCTEKIPDSVNCLYYLGSIYVEQGQDDSALQAFLMIDQLYPDQVKVLQLIGELHLKREDYPKALEIFKRVFRLTPEDVSVQIRLGWLYYQLGDVDYALQVFEQIRKTFPQSDKVNYFLALLYLEKTNLDAALGAFKNIQPESTFFKKSVVQQLGILVLQQRQDQVVSHFTPYFQHVEDAWLHQFLGWHLIETDRLDDAISCLSQGIRRFGNDEDLLFARALAYERQNQWEKSKNDLLLLLSYYPDSAKANNFLGYSMAEHGEDLAKALVYVEKANQTDPNKPHIQDSLGWIYFKMGDVNKALDYLHAAVRLDKNEPTVLEHLGDVHLYLNEKNRARDYYEQSLKILQNIEPKLSVHLKQIENLQKKLSAL